jgi:hypothetical protein
MPNRTESGSYARRKAEAYNLLDVMRHNRKVANEFLPAAKTKFFKFRQFFAEIQ